MEVHKQKRTIFFCPGPEYLFYDTGINNLWELSRSYAVVLLLDFPYSDFNKLDQLKEKGVLLDYICIYFNPTINLKVFKMFQRHRNYYRQSRSVFNKYKPVAIIQHSDFYPLNLYWFREASLHNCARIKILGSHATDDPDNDIRVIEIMHIGKIQYKFNTPYWLAYLFFTLNRITAHYLGYYLVPFFITGHFFSPNIRPIPINKKWYRKKVNYFEHSLVYSEKVKRGMIAHCGEPATAIRNPLYDVGDEVFSFLYGKIEQEDEILILPTDGETEYIRKVKKISEEEVIQYFFVRWSEAIDIMIKKFPSYKVCIKLKLSQANDLMFQSVARRLTEHNSDILILPSNENTQKLILRAKVIVSSTSAVLWWANHLKSRKILVSLDIFDTPDGTLFSKTNGICYFDSLRALSNFDFSQIPLQHGNIESGITLTQFMEQNGGI